MPKENPTNYREPIAIFHEYFPDGDIKEIGLADCPEEVRNFFEKKSEAHLTREEYRPDSFSRVFLVKHKNSDATYLAVQTKIFSGNRNNEELTYLADTRRNKLIGYGELLYKVSDDSERYYHKPYIAFTNTFKKYVKQGLGTRRIFLMNALAQMFYQLPLYSDTLNSPDMKNIWRGLAKAGRAKKFQEGGHDRYVVTDRS